MGRFGWGKGKAAEPPPAAPAWPWFFTTGRAPEAFTGPESAGLRADLYAVDGGASAVAALRFGSNVALARAAAAVAADATVRQLFGLEDSLLPLRAKLDAGQKKLADLRVQTEAVLAGCPPDLAERLVQLSAEEASATTATQAAAVALKAVEQKVAVLRRAAEREADRARMAGIRQTCPELEARHKALLEQIEPLLPHALLSELAAVTAALAGLRACAGSPVALGQVTHVPVAHVGVVLRAARALLAAPQAQQAPPVEAPPPAPEPPQAEAVPQAVEALPQPV